jgi:hypothetical protein
VTVNVPAVDEHPTSDVKLLVGPVSVPDTFPVKSVSDVVEPDTLPVASEHPLSTPFTTTVVGVVPPNTRAGVIVIFPENEPQLTVSVELLNVGVEAAAGLPMDKAPSPMPIGTRQTAIAMHILRFMFSSS